MKYTNKGVLFREQDLFKKAIVTFTILEIQLIYMKIFKLEKN